MSKPNPYETALTACAVYEGLMHTQYTAGVRMNWPYQTVVDMTPEQGGVEMFGLVASVAEQLEITASAYGFESLRSVWAYDVAEQVGVRLHAVLQAGTFVSAKAFVDAEFPAIWRAANA